MIDARTEELVHEELDGCLDEAGRAELQQRLAGDAEARALRADLARMQAAWASLAPLPLPPGLQARLREGLSREPIQPVPSRSSRVLRPLSALAAGLLLAALGLSWFAPGLLQTQVFPAGQPQAGDPGVGATLAAPIVQGKGAPLAAAALARDVSLQPSGEGWRLVLDLAPRRPVVVRLAYDATALRLLGYPANSQVSEAGPDGRAVIASTGGRLEMRLESRAVPAGDRAQVRVRLESEGGEVRETLLEAGPDRQ